MIVQPPFRVLLLSCLPLSRAQKRDETGHGPDVFCLQKMDDAEHGLRRWGSRIVGEVGGNCSRKARLAMQYDKSFFSKQAFCAVLGPPPGGRASPASTSLVAAPPGYSQPGHYGGIIP